MRDLRESEIERYREVALELSVIGKIGNGRNGLFTIPWSPLPIRVIASSGDGWDHVSVSLPHRCPTWEEMEYVRRMVSNESEVWVQFGIPSKDHINCHPYFLHWWRDVNRGHRTPPGWMVGPKL